MPLLPAARGAVSAAAVRTAESLQTFHRSSEPSDFFVLPRNLVRPGQENLEVHYTGLSLIKSDQVRFKYRLEGAGSDWVDAGTRRVAYFSYLPPGSYTFKVIAANSDGVWNTEGATLSVVIHPPFWRTWWFMSLVGLTLAGMAFTAYRYRIAKTGASRQSCSD